MEGELVDIMALDFRVIVEDGQEELAFLEYDQSGTRIHPDHAQS